MKYQIVKNYLKHTEPNFLEKLQLLTFDRMSPTLKEEFQRLRGQSGNFKSNDFLDATRYCEYSKEIIWK